MCPNNLDKSFDPLIIKKIPRYECSKKCSTPSRKALTTPPPQTGNAHVYLTIFRFKLIALISSPTRKNLSGSWVYDIIYAVNYKLLANNHIWVIFPRMGKMSKIHVVDV